MISRLALLSVSASLLGCVGTTGSSLFTFEAAASGPSDATQDLTFLSPYGFQVELEHATLHVGAAYLDAAVPISGAGNTDCIQPDISDALVYVGQVTHELTVNLLEPTPQRFPGLGEAIGDTALAGEVWLTHGDIDDPNSTELILDIGGKATQSDETYEGTGCFSESRTTANGKVFPFEAKLTIGQNRLPPVEDPSQPSAHPICKERIVTPIPLRLTPTEGGSLLLRIDPRGMFTDVDFSQLKKVSEKPLLYQFEDNDDDPASLNLYQGLHGSNCVYDFQWEATKNP